MPGECKSILNVKCLHKSHIAELFELRVFFFGGSNFFLVGKNFWLNCTPPPPFFFIFFWIGGGAIKPEFEVVLFFREKKKIEKLKNLTDRPKSAKYFLEIKTYVLGGYSVYC